MFLLVFIILLHHWNGLNYLCCEFRGGGHQCWDNGGPYLLMPSLTEDSKQSMFDQCDVQASHAYFDFMEP